MQFQEIQAYLKGIPFIDPKRAKILYEFILTQKPEQCLELGFAHGASSCYIAAALDEIGSGYLTSVDLSTDVVQWDPSIEDLLHKTGLKRYVTAAREKNSYTWFLKKMIEENTTANRCQPIYDFCFIDGAKNWTIDGLAFFLVDKLLKTGGWILFDDLNWTYLERGIQEGRAQVDGVTVRELGQDEMSVPHIERVFRLLVMQHPDYAEFKIQDEVWGWAHKIQGPQKTVQLEETFTLRDVLIRALRKIGRKL